MDQISPNPSTQSLSGSIGGSESKTLRSSFSRENTNPTSRQVPSVSDAGSLSDIIIPDNASDVSTGFWALAPTPSTYQQLYRENPSQLKREIIGLKKAHRDARQKFKEQVFLRQKENFHFLRDVRQTGVTYVTNEAIKLGFSMENPEWANFGQGAPEVGPLPNAPERKLDIQLDEISLEYGPVQGIKQLREKIANYYNELYRDGLSSKYTYENVMVAPGGRAAITRVLASLGEGEVGYFLPDYTAYQECLGIFDRISPTLMFNDYFKSETMSSHKFEEQVAMQGLHAVLMSNPNNPTGNVIEGEELANYVATARNHQCAIIVDEFYSHYYYGTPPDDDRGGKPVELENVGPSISQPPSGLSTPSTSANRSRVNSTYTEANKDILYAPLEQQLAYLNPFGSTARSLSSSQEVSPVLNRGNSVVSHESNESKTQYVYGKDKSKEYFPSVSSAKYVENVDTDPIIIINGLTKSWRCPGLRVCWVVAPKAIVSTMTACGSFLEGGANHPSQFYALPLMNIDFIKEDALALQTHFKAKRDYMVEELTNLGFHIKTLPKTTFYIFACLSNLPHPLDQCLSFMEAALHHKVIIVPGSSFDINPGKRRYIEHIKFSDFVRFSYGPPMNTLQQGIKNLKTMINEAAIKNIQTETILDEIPK